LVTVGDAPAAVARFRVFNNADGSICAQIDRLAVLHQYRGQGYSKRCMQDILAEVKVSTNNSVSALLITIPCESWIKLKLESLGWRHFDSKPIELRGQRPYLDMFFYVQPS
jgi:GNAT superfamily N-acetyltransferase